MRCKEQIRRQCSVYFKKAINVKVLSTAETLPTLNNVERKQLLPMLFCLDRFNLQWVRRYHPQTAVIPRLLLMSFTACIGYCNRNYCEF